MFGYIRPYKSELLVKEYEVYKGIYCALCKELGRSFGIGARYVLSYDCTFYAMLALSVSDSETALEYGRCKVNPTKACKFILSHGDEYKKAAALSMIMTYYKCCDNIEDEKFLKALGARLGRMAIKRKWKKAVRMYPFMEEIVRNAMLAQKKEEENENASIDSCAEPTAHMLSMLFQELAAQDSGQAEVLKQLGYFLGRWVYIIDASDDLKSDLEKGGFNPFIKRLSLEAYQKKHGNKVKPFEGDVKKSAEVFCNEALNSNIALIIPALNLLEMHNFREIIENVLLKGLPEIQREILFLHVKEKKR